MGSAAFLAPDTFTSPCSAGPPFTTILSMGPVSRLWLGGHRLCPKCQAVPPLQVLLHARVFESRGLEQLPDCVPLGFPNLHCKEAARQQAPAGPFDDAADEVEP